MDVADQTIIFRVSSENKARMVAAAASRGKSLSGFLTETVMQAVVKIEKSPPRKMGGSRGVPTYFRAHCDSATRGGTSGYHDAGFHLAIHLSDLMPGELSPGKWESQLDRLRDLLAEDDERAVSAWFAKWFPGCMALVPDRRRAVFVAGVRRAHDEGRV